MNRLRQCVNWVCGLTGWRRLLFSFVAGAISAAGFEPLNIFALLLLSYGALVLLIDGAAGKDHRLRNAAIIGWAFYFGQYLAGWYWLGYAFLVDPAHHLWQMPFAVVALPAAVALLGAGASVLGVLFWVKGPSRLLVFAIVMGCAEWLRGHVFTGFPWNLPGYSWGASLAVLQGASVMGAYGLSFLTILFGASLADLFAGRLRPALAMSAVFLLMWGYGLHRLESATRRDVPGVFLRLVQPDIPQREKINPRYWIANWEKLMALSLAPDRRGLPTHIIWPESATGFAIARAPGAIQQLKLLTRRGQTMILGSVRLVQGPHGEAGYNSLYLFAPHHDSPLVYDKFHLVPFGEYVPFAKLLSQVGFTQITDSAIGFSAGDHPHVMAVPGAPPMTPLICYEVIFPHAVTDGSAPRPGWFVNITDDSWFGPWAGPRQHFLIARVRAIEEGLPIVRDANTGISAVIDAVGRVRAELGLNKSGDIDTALPVALPPTIYARFGDLVFLLLLVVAAIGAILLNHPRSCTRS